MMRIGTSVRGGLGGLLLVVAAGCGPRPDEGRDPAGSDPAVVALRAGFAEHAPRVLGERGGTALVAAAAGGGFVPAPPAAAAPLEAAQTALARRGGLQAAFPAHADDPVRLSFADGFSIQVHEVGLRGVGRLARGAVVYRRGDDATASFWSATEAGYEEWLLARPAGDGAVATWRVIGGFLRQRGTAVEVVDASGRARVRVTAPAAYDQRGAPVGVRLSAAGERLALTVTRPAGASPGGERSLVLVDPLWQTAGSMPTGRRYHTATLLLSGKVLVAGGSSQVDPSLAPALIYAPTTGTFAATSGPLATGRINHTATLLQSGRVLVVGGRSAISGVLATAEVYDPATDTFTATGGSLATGREYHTATLLRSGKVLVVGGTSASAQRLTAEVYDPQTDAFTATSGSLQTARVGHSATLLASGGVLIVGGWGTGGLAGAELYNPATGTFAATSGALGTARGEHEATLLSSGKVLIASGLNASSTYLTSAELYDPATGSFAPTSGPLATPRVSATITLLPSGLVLIAGGRDSPMSTELGSAELFNPTTGIFTATTGPLATPRQNHTATLLPSGAVIVMGGSGPLASTEIYDPSTGTFVAPAGPLATPRWGHTATPLPSGKVLLAGGGAPVGSVTLATAELFDPATGTSAAIAGPLATARKQHTATLLRSGKVLLAGGTDGSTILDSAELYDPATNTFAATGQLTTPRRLHAATLLPSGKVVVIAGTKGGPLSDLVSAEVYDPTTGTFAATPGTLATPRLSHTATPLPSGKVLVAGGYRAATGTYLASAELFDPITGTFAATSGPLTTQRCYHSATRLPSGQVLLAGGTSLSVVYLTTAELFDPATSTFAATSGPLATGRRGHSATLLPSGKVVVAGGLNSTTYLTSAELFDPATRTFTKTSGSLTTGRREATATLLSSGKVLVAGGSDGDALGSAELYDEGRGAQAAWTPVLAGPVAAVRPGGALPLSGTLFTGVSEASGGGDSQSSATNYPLVLLRRQDSDDMLYAPVSSWTSTTAAASVPATVVPGFYVIWVIANGVLSNGQPVTVFVSPAGAACAHGYECASGSCADGRCCDTSCTASCMSCNVPGHEGACTVLPRLAEDPLATVACVAPQACDGAGGCKLANGQSCSTAPQCASTFCANGVCCESACDGVCQVCAAGGLCGGCASDRYCDGNGCVPKLTLAGACTSDSQCQSDHCADDVCCATACQGNCEQCNVTGNVGQCWPVANGTDPKNKCQAAVGGHPACAGSCQARQCAFPDVGTSCGLCAACDGTGRCTETPADDATCGVVECGGLDTACRVYEDLTASRCATLGVCKAANDPATCSIHTDLPCADGGVSGDGGTPGDGGGQPGADAGGTPGDSSGCGCRASGDLAPSGLLALALALVLTRRRRRRAGLR